MLTIKLIRSLAGILYYGCDMRQRKSLLIQADHPGEPVSGRTFFRV